MIYVVKRFCVVQEANEMMRTECKMNVDVDENAMSMLVNEDETIAETISRIMQDFGRMAVFSIHSKRAEVVVQTKSRS